jgi:CheY-like chemotaxis protein
MTLLKTYKILVAEDDTAMRDIISHKLKTSGFSVVEASDGKQASELIVSEKPDLVLLDLLMPEMNGFQVLEGVRQNSDANIANTPVIVLSNLWSNKDILQAEALKVQAYMVKAYFDTNDILKKVNEILEGLQTGKFNTQSAVETQKPI